MTSVFRPFTQYLVEAPFAAIKTLSLLRYDMTSFAHLDFRIFCYSPLQILSSSVRFDEDRRWEAVFMSLQGSSMWFKSGLWLDIHRGVPKPLLHCLGCVLMVTVLLEGELSAESEVQSTPDQVFIEDISVICSVQLSLNPNQLPSPCHWKEHPKHDAAMPPCFPIWVVSSRWWAVPGFL